MTCLQVSVICRQLYNSGTRLCSKVPNFLCLLCLFTTKIRKLETAVAVRNSLLEKFSGKFRRCWKIIHRFSGSTKCYACQGLGIFRQGKWLLENWPRLRECFWIFSSETATAFLSFSEKKTLLEAQSPTKTSYPPKKRLQKLVRKVRANRTFAFFPVTHYLLFTTAVAQNMTGLR